MLTRIGKGSTAHAPRMVLVGRLKTRIQRTIKSRGRRDKGCAPSLPIREVRPKQMAVLVSESMMIMWANKTIPV